MTVEGDKAVVVVQILLCVLRWCFANNCLQALRDNDHMSCVISWAVHLCNCGQAYTW